MKRFITTFIAGILSYPFMLVAQNDETYIDNLGVQDSSYMEQDLLAESARGSGSGTTTIIIIVVVVVIIAIGFWAIKKKKK